MPEVDEASAAALSSTARGPAKFPQPASARDDTTRFGIPDQFQLQQPIVLIAQEIEDSGRERPRLHNHHGGIIRQWRTSRKVARGA